MEAREVREAAWVTRSYLALLLRVERQARHPVQRVWRLGGDRAAARGQVALQLQFWRLCECFNGRVSSPLNVKSLPVCAGDPVG